MGKAITYITILIFIDMFFIVTGQVCSGAESCSIGSIIFNAILDLGNLSATDFFKNLLGNILDFASSTTGIWSLIVGAVGVGIGTFLTKSDSLLFLSTAGIALGVLTSDFVFIYKYLASLNQILATLVMAPIMILYVLVILDWSRGKD